MLVWIYQYNFRMFQTKVELNTTKQTFTSHCCREGFASLHKRPTQLKLVVQLRVKLHTTNSKVVDLSPIHFWKQSQRWYLWIKNIGETRVWRLDSGHPEFPQQLSIFLKNISIHFDKNKSILSHMSSDLIIPDDLLFFFGMKNYPVRDPSIFTVHQDFMVHVMSSSLFFLVVRQGCW